MIRLLVLCVALALAPTATADGFQYAYGGKQAARSATLTLDSSQLAGWGTHTSVWLGVQSGTVWRPDAKIGLAYSTSWLQVGIFDGYGNPPCVYVERRDQTADTYAFTCLRPYVYGTRVDARLTFSQRFGWVAWADGKAVGSATLPGPVVHYATTETYGPVAMASTVVPS